MYLPPPKLKAILKYFCENTNSSILGKTKLMKLFYFLDFTHVKKYGVPITGDTYYRLERGPIPSSIKNLVDTVEIEPELSILSDTIEISKTDDKLIHQVKCLENFSEKDRGYFSEIEFETLKDVCEKFKNYTTNQIIDASHKQSPWKNSLELAQIPYTMAAKDADCEVSREDIQLLAQLV